MSYFKQKMDQFGIKHTKERLEMLNFDAELNAMGILVSAKRISKKSD